MAGRRGIMATALLVALGGAAVAGPQDRGGAAAKRPDLPTILPDKNGRLAYQLDRRGNRVPDFSHCGYRGGNAAIPDVPVRVVVSPGKGDNGPRIQAAIDYVSKLPADTQGIRGAVLLLAGRHEIAGGLHITTGGVVLRGQGPGPGGAVLVATGTDRRTVIRITGQADRQVISESPYPVADAYVPISASQLRLQRTTGLQAGDTILVEHPSTAAWITALGMDHFPGQYGGSWLDWRPGTLDLRWDRIISKIDGDTITLDAPLTAALDASLSRAQVVVYHWPGRIRQVGVENLCCESAHGPANPHDEEHAWMAVTMDAVQDAWVRQVTARHFAGSAVMLLDGCKAVTVTDCQSLEPVSEIGGYRRQTFYTSGQLTLFQRCRSEEGIHDFAAGYLAAGPNAFLECEAVRAHGFSGPVESWAAGVLYDNVTLDGGGLTLTNREIDAHGAGWSAAYCVLWQCTAPVITCRRPPTAYNWAVGCWGQFVGDGAWEALNQFVNPASLYRAQLEERRGAAAVADLQRRPIPTDAGKAPSVDDVAAAQSDAGGKKPAGRLAVRNGWLVCGDELLAGGRTGTTWWRGSILPSVAAASGKGVTRFVPGRVGPGFTDDLDQLTDRMLVHKQALLEHHWGLWYDRRRDDHQMVRRLDGDVWAPFYEQPWARSGRGTAWDGLSKYDLMRFNPWYFRRLKQFADLCDQKGLGLVEQMYFQHNVLEAGAHWADFPWRPANCLQDTGFPEPPPYANKKRVFMAGAFYDVTHPVRRQLHRAYIRKCLDNFADNTNVIYLTGAEYTGPLEFVRFWLDTIREWQTETGKPVLVGLSCTKDVQDAILADPVRGPQVALIDLRYWWYAADGTLYAPKGGENLAPRQQLREWKGNKSRSAAQTARQVRDYRHRYPEKAILCSFDKADGWAVLAAGGSVPNLPGLTDARLRAALPRMKPWTPESGLTPGQWALADPDRDYFVYASAGGDIRLDLSASQASYVARWIQPRTGTVTEAGEVVRGGRVIDFAGAGSAARVLWLTRKSG
jgi:hypothetical protein